MWLIKMLLMQQEKLLKIIFILNWEKFLEKKMMIILLIFIMSMVNILKFGLINFI